MAKSKIITGLKQAVRHARERNATRREAVEITWDSRKKRYVAKMKHYPKIMAYGDTLIEAQQNIERVRYEYIHGTEESV